MTNHIQNNIVSDFNLNKKFLWFKKTVIILIALFACFFVVICLYFLSEKYFFDKFFYQKSLFHGYYQFWPNEISDWQLVAEKFNQDQRNTDLLNLIYAEEGDQEALAYFTKERNPSTFKIAMIGDSMFFGTGVRKKQTIAHYLEKQLENNDRKIRVYNFSFAGDDLLDNYLKYQSVKKHLQPDLIILALVNNDLIFDNFTRYPGKRELYEKLKESCQDLEMIEWTIEDRKKEDFDVNALVFFPSFKKNSQNFCFLNQLSKIFNKEDTMFFLIGCADFTCEDEIAESYCLDAEIYTRFLSAFDKNIPTIDLCNFKTILVSEKEQHFSKTTNFEISQKLTDFIIEKYPMFQ